MKLRAWTWALLVALPIGFGSFAVGCHDDNDLEDAIDEAGDDIEDAVD
jgi:hypothetical protein